MSLETLETIRFYEYSVDRLRWVVQWQGEAIPLSPRSFELLLYLIDHRDRLVSKEELLSKLWPDQFVEESNLSQHVFLLRKAFSRHEGDRKLILTVPGRGYRFTAPVLEPEVPEEPARQIVLSATESITRITVEEEEDDAVAATPEAQPASALPAPRRVSAVSLRTAVWLASGLAVLAVAGWFGWQHYLDQSKDAPVQVVLAPMQGTTGDPILDVSLVQALRMDLVQSPYVSVVPSSTVRATLTSMMRKPDDPMNAATSREVCERTNSQGLLTGTIAKIGEHFLVTEEATSCVDGSVLGEAKYDAAKAEELPYAMGKMAATLRQKLGESRRSIARFNTPLFQQDTASLDALKAYTQGTQKIVEGKFPEAIALLNHSVAADPQFAAAYYNLSAAYGSSSDDSHAREALLKAYALRDRATAPTRLGILAAYSSEFTGDAYELVRTYQSWVDLYPNSSQAWSGLTNAQGDIDMEPEALASQQRTVQLLPHSQGMLANLALHQYRNNQPQAAQATCERAIADHLDGDGIRFRYLQVAYLLKDQALLQALRAWEQAHPDAVQIRAIEGEIAMAEGRFQDARRITLQLQELRQHQGLAGPDQEMTKFAAVDMMQCGEVEAGRRLFKQTPVDIEDGQQVVGLAYLGDLAAAKEALHTNEVKYPRATMVQIYWGPRIRAIIALAENKPAEAAADLEVARPLDATNPITPWLRGNAYLAAGQPAVAEKEYRTVIAHAEWEPTSPYLSLSWLGLARALKAEGNRQGAIDAYHHFLELWAHADPDAIFLQQAKRELASLS